MPPTTRSAAVEKQDDEDKPKVTLEDVMQSLNIIITAQSSHADNIAILNKRMTEVENIVF